MPPRRVLVIAHHFPPAGGSGSNRALAFARYLPDYGWQPLVLTPGLPWAANRDTQLLSQLPPGLPVIRTRSLEARPTSRRPHGDSFAVRDRRPSAIRSNVGHLKRFPDAHLGWLPCALGAARRLSYDVIYSSSGPFTSHLVGLLLKRFTHRPWVAELRDGWYRWNRAIFPDYPAWRDSLERGLEAAAIRSADRVVLVTDRMADAFRHQYADLPAGHFATISNGFDRVQFQDSPAPQQTSTSFEVVHAGALYYGRSLAAFLEAARRLIEVNPDFSRQFRLTLLGTLDGNARAELTHYDLSSRTTCSGQLGHVAAIAAMRSASVLLLVANTTPGAEATVPGKLFEYLAIGRPILAIAPPACSTVDVLNLTGGGWLAQAGDPADIAYVLLQAFRAFHAGTHTAPDPAQVDRFDRRLLAGDLANLFTHVVSAADAARRF